MLYPCVVSPEKKRKVNNDFGCFAKSLQVEVIVEGVDLLEKVRKPKVKDNKVVKAVEEIKQAGVKILRDKE